MTDTNHLIVGLGNPGADYEKTRHNVGFCAIDAFARELGCSLTSEKWHGLFCRERFGTAPLLLLKPQTYMNRSGESVVRFCEYYKITPEHILVLHDDLDLPFGRIKVVARGGHGGHNGIRSIISHLGSSDFSRVKIGIGRPQTDDKGSSMPVDRFVLARFTAEEWRLISEQFILVNEAIRLFLEQGVTTAMNRINGRS